MSDDIRVPRRTLKWWRELVDLNPADLAPRMDALLAAPPAAPDSAKLVSELRDHADEQGRDDAAAISSWGYLRSQTTRELLEKAANWIEQHDTQTAQP